MMSSNRLKLGWATALALALVGACGTGSESNPEELGLAQQALFVSVPARIQAESYERANETTPEANSGGQCDRNDGVDMETTTDPNGGNCNVGWTAAGEWLEYDINTPTARTFDITARVASDVQARTFRILLDGVSLGTQTAPATGWQSFQDRTYANVSVSAGNHTLRVVFDNGEVNFNYLDFTANSSGPTCTDGIQNGTETGVDCGGSCPACPSGCIEQALTPIGAVASSLEEATYPASAAIDGNTGTRWSSLAADPQWIYVDLGATRRISRVVLNWEVAASANYDIQVSNSTSGPWSAVYTTTAGNGGIDTITGLSATGRYVRMYSRARTTQWGNSLWEFQVFGDPNPDCSNSGPTCTDGVQNGTETGVDCGGSCPACSTCTDGVQNGTETGVDCGGSCPACSSGCIEQALTRTGAVASSLENATYPASAAIDGNTGTRWSSERTDPQWIYVDLGATRRISRVVLNWEVAASANYDIQVSNSTSGPWSPVYTTTAGDGGIDTITGLTATGRYVRMYSRARTTPYGNSLWEFEVFGDPNPNCSSSACVNPDATNTTPLSLARADIGARQIIGGIGGATRLALDPISGKLHYMTIGGNIFQLDVQAGSGSTSQQIVSGAQIMSGTGLNASTFQGMAFAPNGALYVVANVDGGATNRAFVRRGTGTGSRTWSTFAQTDPYADSNTPFDHHFSGVVVSPDGTSVYLTSGSRTDHGEVQDTGGQFPGTREVPLTAAMFRLPASGSNILLRNDTNALVSAGYLFATGLRNSYDPVFGPGGEIFAGDNGPDADYSEELNVIRSGQHYGFPWRLGAENNSQQFSSYDPATDPRLHAGFAAVDNGSYRNDPTFPPAPSGLIDPIPNRGPDADLFRDVVTGGVVDASATGRGINTFTAHRVPLGLSFDLSGTLCGDFQNQAFILSWGSAVPVFTDKGEDLLMLNLKSVAQGYEVEARQIITGLSRPIDSVLLGNKLYVLEYADGATGRLFEIALPRNP